KKAAGVETPLQEKTDWYPTTDEWIDIKFIVNGNHLQIYINDRLELSGTDYELTNGGIAAAIYRSNILIDDVIVTEIEATLEEPVDPGPRPEPGGTYYVSPTGSDLNPGTESQPWRTMAQAAKLAQRGDTIIFEDG